MLLHEREQGGQRLVFPCPFIQRGRLCLAFRRLALMGIAIRAVSLDVCSLRMGQVRRTLIL